MHKIKIFCLLLTACSLLFPTNAKATQEFTTSYKSIYTIDDNGRTLVNHNITLTNNLANIYPKKYALSIGGSEITDIAVTSSGKALPFAIEETAGITNLQINLPYPSIGQNATTNLNITYQSTSLALHTGNVWEINIPRLRRGGELEKVERIINFPSTLGTPSSAVPHPDSIVTEGKNTIVSYISNRSDAISLLFGTHQSYDLNLRYFIQNLGLEDALTEIAIPPDTGYQQIILNSIIPEPSEIVVDTDGNWLAKYFLKRGEKKEVKVSLLVKVSPQSIYFDPSRAGSHLLTGGQKFWETDNSLVKQTATQLKTAPHIYSYLVDRFVYNSSRIQAGAERYGATRALAFPTEAICTEFTDSFVALSRASGIPSREINGYAVTNNTKVRPLGLATDILHAWAEYYDYATNKWVSVDPTWGNTTGGIDYLSKLDFGHITFVRHGLESSYPYPAGVYKTSNEDKSIDISASNTQALGVRNWEISQENGEEFIVNTGNIAITNTLIRDLKVIYLPPYGRQAIDNTLAIVTPNNQKSTTIYTLVSLLLAIILVSTIIYFASKPKMK